MIYNGGFAAAGWLPAAAPRVPVLVEDANRGGKCNIIA